MRHREGGFWLRYIAFWVTAEAAAMTMYATGWHPW